MRLPLRSASKWSHLLFPTHKNSVGVSVSVSVSVWVAGSETLFRAFFHRICAAVLGGHSSGRDTEETFRVERARARESEKGREREREKREREGFGTLFKTSI